MARYRVLIDDNFHHMDESWRRAAGIYATAEAAEAKCRASVDRSLAELREPGMSAGELYDRYVSFGEDPFIRVEGVGEAVEFSAWDYAKARCRRKEAG
jgi:hypothetical protein